MILFFGLLIAAQVAIVVLMFILSGKTKEEPGPASVDLSVPQNEITALKEELEQKKADIRALEHELMVARDQAQNLGKSLQETRDQLTLAQDTAKAKEESEPVAPVSSEPAKTVEVELFQSGISDESKKQDQDIHLIDDESHALSDGQAAEGASDLTPDSTVPDSEQNSNSNPSGIFQDESKDSTENTTSG